MVCAKRTKSLMIGLGFAFAVAAAPELVRPACGAGRVISPVATPLTIAEGAWDWGALIYCAFGN
jgi:hypothetical protein